MAKKGEDLENGELTRQNNHIWKNCKNLPGIVNAYSSSWEDDELEKNSVEEVSILPAKNNGLAFIIFLNSCYKKDIDLFHNKWKEVLLLKNSNFSPFYRKVKALQIARLEFFSNSIIL